MWTEAETTWDRTGVVEYGVHQLDRKTNAPLWRRHQGPPQTRFRNVRNALFSDKGARCACLGKAPYARNRYAASDELFVPYAATWLRGADIAYLVRASARHPEVTLVPVGELEAIHPDTDGGLLAQLAALFADGAEAFGVRWLAEHTIEVP